MPSTSSIIVIDPIFRGSRLMYTAHVTNALHRSDQQVLLLTRREAVTPHYTELFNSLPHKLLNRIPVPASAWYTKLSRPLIIDTLKELGLIIQSARPKAVIFSGWNEFFPTLAMLRTCHLASLKQVKCFAFDYSPHFWLKPQTSSRWERFQLFFKRILTQRVLARLPNLNFFVADERLHDAQRSDLPMRLRHRYTFLPEIAPLRSLPPAAAAPDPIHELLVVGGQNRRKGLEDILAALKSSAFPNHLRVRLVGRLGDDLEHLRTALQAIPSQRLIWEEKFLSDAEIRLRYERCDFVALPYTKKFHATSSVLAWAAAHGKPVIATDHGLIGFRVHQNRLGMLYPSGDVSALVKVLRCLPKHDTEAYSTLSKAGLAFAESCSLKQFEAGLTQAVLNT